MDRKAQTLRLFFFSFLVAGLFPSALTAQAADTATSGGGRAATTGRRGTVTAAQATEIQDLIQVDGRLDEADWDRAIPVTHFTQTDPHEGAPVSEATAVRFLYDQTALYVGARLRDDGPVSSRLGRRDAHLQDSDWLEITLDSYHNHLSAYRFQINPAGVKGDEVLSNGNDWWGDSSWDPVWDAATQVTDSGWVAEIRIPFSQLRFRPTEEQVWGLQIQRNIGRKQEEAVFAFTPKSEPGGIAAYGRLEGLRDIGGGAGLEVLPYLLGRAEYRSVAQSEDVSFANPFRDGSSFFGGVGVNLKYRVTPNLTLDAAVNPDFGQVEADPAVVNLSAFETRLDEKRPFFVEGSDIFQFGGGGGHGGTQLLYSRRIGRRPPLGVPDDAVYSNAPDASTILGAVKLTGRTPGGWSVGILDAVTGRETARYVDSHRQYGTAVVAPPTNHLAARIQRYTQSGENVVGALVTAVNRNLSTPALTDNLRASAYTAGVDWKHQWADRAWSLTGFLAASHIQGDSVVMQSAQESSARYYQRPDAGYLRVDSSATTLTGYSGNLQISRDAGLHWRGSAHVSFTSPGFEVNDLGFQTAADRVESDVNLRYVENTPGPVLREWNLSIGPNTKWNFGRTYLGTDLSLRGEAQLLNYWRGNLRVSHRLPGYDDRLTRGGPLARQPRQNSISVDVRSDSRQTWTMHLSGNYSREEGGGGRRRVGLEVGFKQNAWSLSLQPEVEYRRSGAQYVSEVEDGWAQATYGARYIFADLRQHTVSVETRLNITFRPELTLEVYAQPFLANASFRHYKELAEPGTYSFLQYGRDVGTLTTTAAGVQIDPDGSGPASPFTLDNQDFNRASLRGNAVLRWEWRPGSTIFLVWQQSRSYWEDQTGFDLRGDTNALFGQRPENIFLLKVNYWLNP